MSLTAFVYYFRQVLTAVEEQAQSSQAQASVAEGDLNDEAVRDVEEISLKLAYWANVEAEIPLTVGPTTDKETAQSEMPVFGDLETRLVDFYSAILEWQATGLLDESGGNKIGELNVFFRFKNHFRLPRAYCPSRFSSKFSVCVMFHLSIYFRDILKLSKSAYQR